MCILCMLCAGTTQAPNFLPLLYLQKRSVLLLRGWGLRPDCACSDLILEILLLDPVYAK